jgi:hypothetical protein
MILNQKSPIKYYFILAAFLYLMVIVYSCWAGTEKANAVKRQPFNESKINNM